LVVKLRNVTYIVTVTSFTCHTIHVALYRGAQFLGARSPWQQDVV